MSNLKFCPHCNETKENAELKASFAAIGTKYAKEDVLNFNKGFLWGIKPKDGEEFITCPFCQTKVVDSGITSNDFDVIEEASNCNRQLLEAMIALKEKDIIEYELKMSQFRNQVGQQKQQEQSRAEANVPKCPTCGSTNIEKISGLERGVSILGWGIFSKKINKTFKCMNCGMTF